MANIIIPKVKFRDSLTYDSASRTLDAVGNMYGRNLGNHYMTHDGRTVDSTGAFLVGELERLDLTYHGPLAAVTWSRDIKLRSDVTLADEVSSFTLSTFGSQGSVGGNSIGNGKAWIGKDTTQITGISVDIKKQTFPLTPWGMELKYTVLELESAAKLGRPIDQQKYEGLQLKHQMDIDEMVYIGDTSLGQYGLVNQPSSVVTNVTNVVSGVSGSKLWSQKTADEILRDVNDMLTSVWSASAYQVIPEILLIPPTQFGFISTTKVSQAGNVSILKYIQENSLLATSNAGRLKIYPLKWLVGAGTGGTIGTANGYDRAVVYTNDPIRIRYPMTLLQRTPIQYDSIFHKTSYYCRLGVIEPVYPQTMGYFDGI